MSNKEYEYVKNNKDVVESILSGTEEGSTVREGIISLVEPLIKVESLRQLSLFDSKRREELIDKYKHCK